MIAKSMLLLIAMATTLAGGDVADRLRLGGQALDAGLWEIAAGHFEAGLADPELDEPARAAVMIRLAEARLRDGRAAEALELLAKPPAVSHPETPFWKGQALAAMGKSSAAIEALTPLTREPLSPFHAAAVFTIANQQLAPGDADDALESLEILRDAEDPELVAKARLRQVEILLDNDRVSEAREALPAADAVRSWDMPVRALLDATILLRENRPDDAAVIFRTLIDKPQGQTYGRYHHAAAGLGQALLDSGQPGAAVAFVVPFLQDHPTSPRLESLFHQLRDATERDSDAARTVLEALELWTTPADFPASGPLPVRGGDAVAAWPSLSSGQDITAHALLTRALILRRAATPEALMKSRRLLNRLRLEFPTHPLAARALFELALTDIAAGDSNAARNILGILKDVFPGTPLHGRAAFVEAGIVHDAGDHRGASRLFDEAASHLPGNQSRAARFNASVLIRAEDADGMKEITVDPETAADVRLERALSRDEDAARISAIEEFLIAHPEHPRAPEARLALAEATLAVVPPDLSLARAQLDTLNADPEKIAALDAARLAMVRLRLADLGGDAEAAITIAREIGEQFPAAATAAEASFVLGRSLFQTEAYNEARMVLEQVASIAADPARAEAAMLLAARSAALVPTSQSQQEALALFRKVIDGNGPLAPVAILENARLMIDMNRLDEAADFLRGWFDSLEKSDPMRLPAGLLLGEAIYARGSASPESLAEALAVYDSLLADAAPHGALYNRLQYLRGRTLEQIPNERAAFSAYYSVLETTEPPAEWHYFELCGFRALALLEKAGRWPAAIACARRIASFNGPRAAEAAERASQLQLSHMIWED